MTESIIFWLCIIICTAITLISEVPGAISNFKLYEACKEIQQTTGFRVNRSDILFLGTRKCTNGKLIKISFDPNDSWEIKFDEYTNPLKLQLTDKRMLKQIKNGLQISATDIADAAIRIIECVMPDRKIITIIDMTKLCLKKTQAHDTENKTDQKNKLLDAKTKTTQQKTEHDQKKLNCIQRKTRTQFEI